MATADELRAVREAGRRMLGNDPPLLRTYPGGREQFDEDCATLADAYLALRAACVRLVAAERELEECRSQLSSRRAGPDVYAAKATALRDITGLVGEEGVKP